MNDAIDTAIDRLLDLSKGARTKLPVPSEEMIEQCEQEIGMPIPEDFRKVLRRASNVFFGPIDLVTITGSPQSHWTDLKAVVADARSSGVPGDWLPICEDNADFYCLVPDGSVRFWSHNGPTQESWPSLAAWIEDIWIASK
ncbi:SMI1/KNR4 family protein [Dyella sp. M7H15-1]|nr:SMI1/KNR4 family protein [Dyella sp. M7H15-1]